jgi:hypothetical protein
MLLVEDDPDRLINTIRSYEPPVVDKWIRAGEQ